MLKVIISIAAILVIILLALFSICACIISSECSRYEGYRRKGENDDE